jgi:hypothetical protein
MDARQLAARAARLQEFRTTMLAGVGRADKAQSCCRTAAIAASVCEVIFELGLVNVIALG